MQARAIAAFAAATGMLAGCGENAEPPVCHAGMPRASQILADPAFAAHKFHIHRDPNWHRPAATDLWADGKFDYVAALQYGSAPKAGAASVYDLCAYSISLRFALPPRDIDQGKLRAFARGAAPGAGMDAARLEAQLADVMRGGDKYRPRAWGATAQFEAGKLFSPARGDFFMVTVAWPRPVSAMGRSP